jgi:hypothetical protein
MSRGGNFEMPPRHDRFAARTAMSTQAASQASAIIAGADSDIAVAFAGAHAS